MRNLKRIRRVVCGNSGMTLLEAVLSMALLAMLVAVCGGLIIASMRASAAGSRAAEVRAAGSAVADYVTGELRYATSISIDGRGSHSLRVLENRLEKLEGGDYISAYDFSGFPDIALALTVTSMQDNRIGLRVSITDLLGELIYEKDFGIILLNALDAEIAGELPAHNAEIFYNVE